MKRVCERVSELHSPLKWAQESYQKGDLESASLGFLIAAEQGYESGQVNLAYLLDNSKGYIDLAKSSSKDSLTAPTGSIFTSRHKNY